MRITIGLLAILLSACGGSTVAPAPTAQTAPSPTAPQGPIAFVGDSITQFWDWGGFDTPEPALSVLVPGEDNDGIAGNRTSDMLSRFTAVLAQHPGIVVILGGTNDIRQIEVPTIDNISAMAEQAAVTGAVVVICSVPPASVSLYPTSMDQPTNDVHIATFNTQLHTMAMAYGYLWVDYHAALVNADGSQNQSLFIAADLIHPNHLGYQAMWTVLQPVVERYLSH